MRRVLLTGASGFLGSQAVGLLVQRGFEVHAVSSRDRSGSGSVDPRSGPADGASGPPEVAGKDANRASVPPEVAGKDANRASVPPEVAGKDADEASGSEEAIVWHRADLLDARSTRELVRQVCPTHLLHFAWYTKHGDFWSSTENLRWVQASLGLLRAFGEHGGRRAVIAGTCAEYDWSQVGRCVEESSPLVPQTLYGVSKDALRRVAQAWAAEQGISLAWGRVFFVFGEREQAQRLLPSVARAVLCGRPAACSHGRQLRDFLHTADAAGAFVALLDSDVQGAVNVGSGQPVSIAELVRLVGEAAGRPELVRLGELPERPGEPRELSADVTRLREQVGWTPTLTLEQGIERAVRWQRRQLEALAAGRGAVSSAGAAMESPSEGAAAEEGGTAATPREEASRRRMHASEEAAAEESETAPTWKGGLRGDGGAA